MNEAYGKRLLIHLIDDRAAIDHSRPYASIPCSRNPVDGFLDVSYRTFANAINRAATWLRHQFGESEDLATIAYIGPADLRYHVLSLGATKSGHVMFFPSPRNNVEAHEALLEQAGTTRIVTDLPPAHHIFGTIARRSMVHAPAPSLGKLLDASPVAPITVSATFEQWRFRPWILLHTSGSTGPPKVVPIKHGMVSGIDAYRLTPQSDVAPRYGNMRVFIPFPPFHIAGINYSLPIMCWYDSTAVFPPVGSPLTAELVHQMHVHGKVSHSILAPSLIVDLAKTPEHLEALSHLSGLTFSGGPLPSHTAMEVVRRVPLVSSMGATEYGGIPMDSTKPPTYYDYFKFNEDLAGLEFRESEQPGLYELVFVRRPDELSQLVQTIFVTFPDLQQYHTKDLYSKHPSEPGLWKYEARLDDVVVFSNGEKLNPIPMEGAITSCPAVKSCIVVGQGRFQAALLAEPEDEGQSRGEFLGQLKPYIDTANRLCPSYGRIDPEMLYVVKGEKKLAKAAKGSIQRARSNAIFETEIAQLYSNQREAARSTQPQLVISTSSRNETEKSLSAWLLQDFELTNLAVGQDLFSLGLDSLQVINLTRAINASIPPRCPKVDPAIVYDHPTVSELAAALQQHVSPGPHTSTTNPDDVDYAADTKDWTAMEKLYMELRSPRSFDTTPSRAYHALRWTFSPPIFPPDGGLIAWSQVLASFLINMNNWGFVNSFGVFQAYYESVLLPGSSATSISWIGTSQGALLLIVGIIAGPLFDKGYFNIVFVISSVGVVLGMVALSFASTYYQVMLAQGIFVGICLGLLYIPSVALISLYFRDWRGTAIGLATAGGSVGGVIYPVVFARILDAVGFAWACRIIGFISLGTLAAAALIIRPFSARSTGVRQLFDLEAFRDLPYVTFLIGGFLVFSGVLVPFFLVTAYARTVGADTNFAFYCATILNGAQCLGRILPAALSDYSRRPGVPGPETILLGAQVVAAILAFCWIAVHSLGGYVAWLVIYGFVSGMNVTLAAVVLPYVCPSMAVLGTRLGMLYGASGVGFLISTPVALATNTASGGYLGSQVWIGVCCMAGACVNVVTAREARRRRRLFEN